MMKSFSVTSVLLLAIALGGGAGIVTTALTLNSLRDYYAAVSVPTSIDLSTERVRTKVDDRDQALAAVREKSAPATVEIFFVPSDPVGVYEPGEGQASGFFITSDGWLVTAPDFFSATEAVAAKILFDQKLYAVQKVVADQDNNLNLLFLKIEITNAPVASFGDPAKLEAGDDLFVVAAPNEIFTTSFFTSIKVGDLIQSAEIVDRRLLLNMALDYRLAGAAVVDSSGETIGLLMADQLSETNFVLPITVIEPVIFSLLKEGQIVYPFFGIEVVDLSRALGFDQNLSRGYASGAFLDTIIKNSPAAVAGLKVGDIILSVGEVELKSERTLPEVLADYRPGETVDLMVDRAGEILKIVLVLGSK